MYILLLYSGVIVTDSCVYHILCRSGIFQSWNLRGHWPWIWGSPFTTGSYILHWSKFLQQLLNSTEYLYVVWIYAYMYDSHTPCWMNCMYVISHRNFKTSILQVSLETTYKIEHRSVLPLNFSLLWLKTGRISMTGCDTNVSILVSKQKKLKVVTL